MKMTTPKKTLKKSSPTWKERQKGLRNVVNRGKLPLGAIKYNKPDFRIKKTKIDQKRHFNNQIKLQ